MLIDAHHHFWQYDPPQYSWISERMAVLKRDYLPGDLETELAGAGIQGVISVQARQTLDETDWLLDLADQHSFLYAVVGWVPLIAADVRRHLERLSLRQKLRAVRHVLQDEPEQYMLQDAFQHGIAQLAEFRLAYDLLIYEAQLPAAIQLVDQHPNQTFVLDHIAKPQIRRGAMEPWRTQLRELARRPHVYCKLSGVATEADHEHWRTSQLMPYLEVALEAFGPDRLMFGSDWPVCLLATSYHRWWTVVHELAEQLSSQQRGQLLGGTAARAYGLPTSFIANASKDQSR